MSTFGNSNAKTTKHLVAAVTDTSPASAKDTSATAKKTTDTVQHTTANAASPTDFQNAGTTTTPEPTSTHSSSATHTSSSVVVSSSAPPSSMPIIISSSSAQTVTASTSAAALPTTTSANSSSQSSPSVAGPVVGSIAGVAVVGAIAFFFIRRRNRQKRSRASHAFSQFLNEAPQHHGDGNARNSVWGMPTKASEKDVNNGYAISPPPPPEKAYNPDFGSPPPMSPPAPYSAYDQQHHMSPPTSPNAGGYNGSSPQAQYGNTSPSHMGGHNAAIAGTAVAGAAAAGAMAAGSHQQQYPNEVNGDMPLSDPYKQQSPQQQHQHVGGQDNAYLQQSPQEQYQNLGGQDPAYYHQSPQQQNQNFGGQENVYYQHSPQQQYQQQPVGYDQQYPGYQQGYQQGPQQYYDPNTQQYVYSQPHSHYNSMYIGTDQGIYEPDQGYYNQYPANAAANVFAHSGNTAENQNQHSYEMMPQQPVEPRSNTAAAVASQGEHVQNAATSEQMSSPNAPSSTESSNPTPAPVLPTIELNQASSAPATDDRQHDQTYNTSAEHNQHSEIQQSNPYVLDVPLEYNQSDPARETLYGLSEHYQYGGEESTGAQELSSGHHDEHVPKLSSHGHNDDLM